MSWFHLLTAADCGRDVVTGQTVQQLGNLASVQVRAVVRLLGALEFEHHPEKRFGKVDYKDS